MIGLGLGGRRRLLVGAMTLSLFLSLSLAAGAHAAVPGWLGQEQVDSHNSGLNAVSCASPSYCVTGGIDLLVQDHAVLSDLTTQLSSDTDEIAAISCAPGTTFCAVTDDAGGVYTLSGETLSARTQESANEFDNVSCPTTSFCMAIDGLGNTYKYASGSWSLVSKLGALASDTTSLQVSCVSSTFCIAAVPAGGASPNENYYKYTGTWNAAAVLSATGATESGLSCTATNFCVAADTSDNTRTYNGASWSAPVKQGSGTSANDHFYVSCAGTFCLADSFEDGSTYLTSNGTTWTTGASLEASGFGSGGPTSCASSTMCVVVDLGGVGNTYALPDTLATQPTLSGSATVGGTISLTPGTAANPDTSVVDSFQRCLGGCTPLSGTSYTTTAADAGAAIEDAETTGVGLDIQGPFMSNSITVTSPSTAGSGGSGASGGGASGGSSGAGSGAGSGSGASAGGSAGPGAAGAGAGAGGAGSTPHALPATVGTPTVSGGSAAQVTVACPAASSASCSVTVTLVVTEKLSGGKVVAISSRKKPKVTTRTVTLGTATATVSPGASKQLTVSLNTLGKRLLSSHPQPDRRGVSDPQRRGRRHPHRHLQEEPQEVAPARQSKTMCLQPGSL